MLGLSHCKVSKIVCFLNFCHKVRASPRRSDGPAGTPVPAYGAHQLYFHRPETGPGTTVPGYGGRGISHHGGLVAQRCGQLHPQPEEGMPGYSRELVKGGWNFIAILVNSQCKDWGVIDPVTTA